MIFGLVCHRNLNTEKKKTNANIRDYVIVRSQLYRKTLAKTLLKVIVLAVGARHCQHAY